MNTDALVQSWLSLISQTNLPHIEPNFASGDANNLACIQKDVPRTYPNELSQHEITILKEELIEYCQMFPQIGYRSGFSMIVAFINRLTNCNKQATKQIFRYVLFSQKVNLLKYITNQQTYIDKMNKAFTKVMKRFFPNSYDMEMYGSMFWYSGIFTMLTYRSELKDFPLLALIWDRIIKGGFYVLLEVIALMISKAKPQGFEDIFKIRIYILTPADVNQIQIRPNSYYQE